jgi:type IV pilus assembly protein PilE
MKAHAIDKAAAVGCSRTGFTLIELMVVVVIAAILAAFAYPSYLEHTRRSRRVEAIAALTELLQREERHYSQQNSYFAFSREANRSDVKWFSGTTPASSSHEISARQCENEPLSTCVQLLAVPGTADVDSGFTDPGCGTLSITSSGLRTPEQPACWK